MTGYDQVNMTETQEWVAHLGCQKLGNCGRYVFLSQVSLTRRRPGLVEACTFMGRDRDISQVAFLVSLSIQDSFEKMNVQAVRTCHRNGLVKDAGTPTSMGTDHLRFFDVLWVFDGKNETCEEQTQASVEVQDTAIGNVVSFDTSATLQKPNKKVYKCLQDVQVLLVAL